MGGVVVSAILHARYRMLADFYPQIAERDRSGQITRTWDYDNPYTVRCSARGILGAGIRVVGSTQQWGEDYEDIEWVKMRVASTFLEIKNYGTINEAEEHIKKAYRVGNIRRVRRARQPELLWRGPDGDSVEFNIYGISPVLDPFDRLTEVDILLKGVTGD